MNGTELDARQMVSMTTAGRQRLRTTAVGQDIGHGAFARVLIDAALDELETDPGFAERVAEGVEAERERYRRG
ncbi:hypothetical protein GCM10027416_11370 [Okibacterium endophyticum]